MRFFRAIAISIGIHVLLAAGLAVLIAKSPVRMKLAELDLSSVDLSFAETVEETAPAMPATAAPSVPDKTPPPRPQEAPEPQRPKEDVRPDLLGEAVLPVPKDSVERMVTPQIPEPEEPSEKPVARPAPVSPPTPAPRQARVDAPPRPKRAIRPEYPKRARERREQGDVTLLLDVTAEGTVSAVTVETSSGFPELDEAAVRAAKAARFTPARLKDVPVASPARLTLSFRLK